MHLQNAIRNYLFVNWEKGKLIAVGSKHLFYVIGGKALDSKVKY
jgi:hypothetical protein